jgi:hypothetical protein
MWLLVMNGSSAHLARNMSAGSSGARVEVLSLAFSYRSWRFS